MLLILLLLEYDKGLKPFPLIGLFPFAPLNFIQFPIWVLFSFEILLDNENAIVLRQFPDDWIKELLSFSFSLLAFGAPFVFLLLLLLL